MAIIREAEEPVQVVEDTLSDRTPQSIQIPMASDPTPRSLPQVTLQNPSLAAWKLLLYCVAFLVALLGSHIAIRHSIPTQADVLENSSSVGGWLMIFGVVIWLFAEIIGQSEAIRRWWVNTHQNEENPYRIEIITNWIFHCRFIVLYSFFWARSRRIITHGITGQYFTCFGSNIMACY